MKQESVSSQVSLSPFVAALTASPSADAGGYCQSEKSVCKSLGSSCRPKKDDLRSKAKLEELIPTKLDSYVLETLIPKEPKDP